MTATDIIASILDNPAPLPDPELRRLEARARREARRRHQARWHKAYLIKETARHAFMALEYPRILAAAHDATFAPDMAEHGEKKTEFILSTLALFALPAPSMTEVRWKERNAKFLVQHRATDAGRAEMIIAADINRIKGGNA